MVNDSSLREDSCLFRQQPVQARCVSLYLRNPEKGSLPNTQRTVQHYIPFQYGRLPRNNVQGGRLLYRVQVIGRMANQGIADTWHCANIARVGRVGLDLLA